MKIYNSPSNRFIKTESLKLECPQCHCDKIMSFATFRNLEEDLRTESMCTECEFKSWRDHFVKTGEVTRLKKEEQGGIKTKLERVWFELNNMARYDYFMEWFGPDDQGNFLDRKEVLVLIEKHLEGIK